METVIERLDCKDDAIVVIPDAIVVSSVPAPISTRDTPASTIGASTVGVPSDADAIVVPVLEVRVVASVSVFTVVGGAAANEAEDNDTSS